MYIIWDRDYYTPEECQLLYATDVLVLARAQFWRLDKYHSYDGGDIQLCIGTIDNELFVELVRQHMLDDDKMFDTMEQLKNQSKYEEIYFNDGSDSDQPNRKKFF